MGVVFEDVFASALQLSPQERLRLIAQVSRSVENELVHQPQATDADDADDWGRELASFILSTDTTAWQDVPEFENTSAWVRQFREDLDARHDAYWRGDK